MFSISWEESHHEARLLPSDALSAARLGGGSEAPFTLGGATKQPLRPGKGAEEYARHIDALVYAEELGFDAIGVNEHHQTAYGLRPAPNLIASALIQRTKTVKIAILGRALPLVNNPIYIAEEFAMLDVMSKGRIIAGFVRGIGSEYHSSGTNRYFSHERFHEAHDLIIRAWTEPGPFAFDGDHFSLRYYVNLWPRPYQSPHPPVWIPSQGSSETVAWAADLKRKYPFLVTFSSADLVARYHNSYRDQARQYGYEAAPDERAREEAGRAVETLFNDFLRQTFEMLMPPGYTSMGSMKNFISMRRGLGGGKTTAEGLIENGTALIGSPRTVLAGIERMRERTGFGILVALLQFGILSDDLTRRNMDLFAAKVMPHPRG